MRHFSAALVFIAGTFASVYCLQINHGIVGGLIFLCTLISQEQIHKAN